MKSIAIRWAGAQGDGGAARPFRRNFLVARAYRADPTLAVSHTQGVALGLTILALQAKHTGGSNTAAQERVSERQLHQMSQTFQRLSSGRQFRSRHTRTNLMPSHAGPKGHR